jgi:hypothetical protein
MLLTVVGWIFSVLTFVGWVGGFSDFEREAGKLREF